VLDDLSTGSADNIAHLQGRPGFECVIDSVMNEALTAELVDAVDVVFHLAAAVGVRRIIDAPVQTIETNVRGTEHVLAAANRKKTPVVVFSTSEVYGKNAAVPFREDADLVMGSTVKHRWAYACSKAIDEFLALAYWRERQLPVIIARLFNTVGPRQTGQYGMVIPNFVRQALAGEPITVHGDGTQTRSFTDVSDVVDALIRLVDEPRAIGEVFNIGNPEEISMRALAERVRVVTGSTSEIVLVPYAEAYGPGFEDMPRRVPDIGKIQEYVGFRPTIALDEILARVVDHMRQSPHRVA
jgi:UDP-glucose 4-epimerase